MKSYRFTKKSTGEIISVIFLGTGCYSIIDGNGKHDVGEWHKEQQYLDVEKGILSKDKNAVVYYAKPFDSNGKWFSSFWQKDLAGYLAEDWLRKQAYQK